MTITDTVLQQMPIAAQDIAPAYYTDTMVRSEERRGGKECSTRWSPGR